jgi:hypothetical protein
MSTTNPSRNRYANAAASGGGNAVYGLGFIGAIVYYFQAADVWWEYLLAPLQAIFWPAFLVYEALQRLLG